MSSDVAQQRIRLAFIVTELSIGGAELMLWKLLSQLDRDRFHAFVFALSPRTDHLLELFGTIGVGCELVGIEPDARAPAGLCRLAGRLRETAPHIVQGWLYHGNIAATVSTRLARLRVPVLWNIRGAPIPGDKLLSRAVTWLGAKLGDSTTTIIYNSKASAEQHERLGYPSSKRLVVPNGFDTHAFRPSASSRLEMRKALRLSPDTLLVGLVGRYHRVKDHDNFLRAAALIAAAHPDVHFVLVGENVDAQNRELRELVATRRLTERVHLLGLRQDIAFVTAALDISVSASTAEGFSNAIGEAMSCGVPCVVTDVGDSAWLVGDTGRSVPARDPQALAGAIEELLRLQPRDRTALGLRARNRIIDNFSLAAIVQRYDELYARIHSHAHACQA